MDENSNKNVAEIKKFLFLSGTTQNQVAIDIGVSAPSVSMVIRGHKKSQRVVAYLIRLGCDPEWLPSSKIQGRAI